MKFKFEASFVAEGTSIEDVLSSIANHVGTIARRIGSEHSLEDCGAEFTIGQVDDKLAAVNLDDFVVDSGVRKPKSEPINLDLDPESAAGKALVRQQEREETERQRATAARANEGRSDAEIMAEHRAKEEAADPANK